MILVSNMASLAAVHRRCKGVSVELSRKRHAVWDMVASLMAKAKAQWGTGVTSRPHTLSAPLIVTLTSYPPRFKTLYFTLRSILNQTIGPDSVILWIAHKDRDKLPEEVLRLQDAGLTIRFCDDIRSYKKIIYAIEEFPGSYFLTADDDAYYSPTWVEEITSRVPDFPSNVLAHRAHRITFGADGMPRRYREWEFNIAEGYPNYTTFPTGVGGVLYPPKVFHKTVTDIDEIMKYCPNADDIWLYWMTSINGCQTIKVGPQRRSITWIGSQSVGLYQYNAVQGDANDQQMRNMVDAFGMPWK